MRLKLSLTLLVFLLFPAFLFNGCSEPDYERIEHTKETYPGGAKKVVVIYEVRDEESVQVERLHFAENGNLLMKGKVTAEGDRDERWESYFPNGEIRSVMHYKDGIKHGQSEVYHYNGELNYKGMYKNGHRAGTWSYYDDKGKKLEDRDY